MKYLLIIAITSIVTLTLDSFRIKKIKNSSLTSKTSDVLYHILMLSFEKEQLNQSSKKIINALRKSYNIDYCTIFSYTEDGIEIVSSNVGIQYHDEITDYANSVFNSLRNNQAQIRKSKSNTYLNYDTAREREVQYSYFVPLKNNEINLGALLIENKNNKMGRNEEDVFKTVSNYITVAFQNLIYYDKVVSISITDSLTGLYNKGYLKNKVKDNIEVFGHMNRSFCIVMVDLDNFKNINDTYGHQFGDIVLKAAADILKGEIKEEEFVCRYGGEEFIMFLKANDEISERVENIRKALESNIISNGEFSVNITGSFGVSQFPNDGNNPDKLIEVADEASYLSKKSGKNKVSFSSSMKGA
jgi:diguanylate cyclase (GGDEF)-like protein